MPTYYHGGRPGMIVGQFILPPSITGARSAAECGAAEVCRRDRVYITTSFEAACLYAGLYPDKRGGHVYVVTPLTELEPDPDYEAEGMSYAVERARIDRVRKLSPNEIGQIRLIITEKLG
ncbi:MULTISPECIES: NAD(+)--rifampin ADP-ribosyltransferase [unclassified Pseudomonas]|uniref:NAD(+)--rifampin ADP-ribosyltransferase n=1 Tax=unclassified Pseudomonas TaxID=196821 RepID=UPI001C60E281|nr:MULTISPECIES: NAD(+)--rifampin ADP-ribosyltransferase [unclassified Pseudomonas]